MKRLCFSLEDISDTNLQNVSYIIYIMRFWLGCHQVRRLGGTSADSASWRGRGEEEAGRRQKINLKIVGQIFLDCQKYFSSVQPKEHAILTLASKLLVTVWTF